MPLIVKRSWPIVWEICLCLGGFFRCISDAMLISEKSATIVATGASDFGEISDFIAKKKAVGGGRRL
jgi:hypothetical protein